MQRSLSSFDIYVIVSELQDLIDNCIEKIYQISRDEIVIRVKNIQTKEKNDIYIRNGAFLSITDKDFEIPLDHHITELKNGELFTVPGWDSKGEFVANITNRGYSYVYV